MIRRSKPENMLISCEFIISIFQIIKIYRQVQLLRRKRKKIQNQVLAFSGIFPVILNLLKIILRRKNATITIKTIKIHRLLSFLRGYR